MVEAIGWLGSVFLAICGIPQAIKCVRDGHADGLSWGFIVFWFLGELFGLVYVINIWSAPLIANYTFNLLLTTLMLRYKLKPRKKLE